MLLHGEVALQSGRGCYLSEFERGLIIGKKTSGWSTRRVAGQVDRIVWSVPLEIVERSGHEKVSKRKKPGLE
ncbi:hypothetical protein TNCV_2515181 [Trichonephila clavipes]|nr:hypothetical protein TNCV_2515181 [Trichonephila clavipes]